MCNKVDGTKNLSLVYSKKFVDESKHVSTVEVL